MDTEMTIHPGSVFHICASLHLSLAHSFYFTLRLFPSLLHAPSLPAYSLPPAPSLLLPFALSSCLSVSISQQFPTNSKAYFFDIYFFFNCGV